MGARSQICEEKKRLSSALVQALADVMHLRTEQTSNIINGGDGLPRIELALKSARNKWEQACKAYSAHLESHDC